MMRAQFEGALYFASVYPACVVYSRARSIRRARTIRGNTVIHFCVVTTNAHIHTTDSQVTSSTGD